MCVSFKAAPSMKLPPRAVLHSCAPGHCLGEDGQAHLEYGADPPAEIAVEQYFAGFDVTGTCREGHTGRLCASCVDGWALQGWYCQQCSSVRAARVTVGLLTAALITALGAWMARPLAKQTEEAAVARVKEAAVSAQSRAQSAWRDTRARAATVVAITRQRGSTMVATLGNFSPGGFAGTASSNDDATPRSSILSLCTQTETVSRESSLSLADVDLAEYLVQSRSISRVNSLDDEAAAADVVAAALAIIAREEDDAVTGTRCCYDAAHIGTDQDADTADVVSVNCVDATTSAAARTSSRVAAATVESRVGTGLGVTNKKEACRGSATPPGDQPALTGDQPATPGLRKPPPPPLPPQLRKESIDISASVSSKIPRNLRMASNSQLTPMLGGTLGGTKSARELQGRWLDDGEAPPLPPQHLLHDEHDTSAEHEADEPPSVRCPSQSSDVSNVPAEGHGGRRSRKRTTSTIIGQEGQLHRAKKVAKSLWKARKQSTAHAQTLQHSGGARQVIRRSKSLFKASACFVPLHAVHVVVSFSQVLASFESGYGVPWPSQMAHVFQLARFLSFSPFHLNSVMCAGAGARYYLVYILTMALPAFLLCMVAGMYVGVQRVWVWRQGADALDAATIEGFRSHGAKTMLFLLFLLYPFLSQSVLSVYNCREIYGSYYLEADYEEQCYTPMHNVFQVVGVVGAICLPLGIPICFYAMLVRHKVPQLAASKLQVTLPR
ncbi:hypothetical protein CYMTET_49388 [Cymbomonas tetramitiformis]|uniref:Uncharacterized protein n=1 Tax=Cymbomonas tetramitiformis TaxID=36881 RepID=A0AAE0EUS4_9CHLO|nr:hypothetical protein CYMTET_49388 [Cymbomonas tetramitiformis]